MFHHLGVKPVDNFYIMAIVFLCVYIAWFLVFSEEASAPPIVINTTKTRKENKKHLLSSHNKNGKGVKDSGGLVSADFSTSQMLGESGLAYAGLAQPCITEKKHTVNPNLPQGYSALYCDPHQGLECITGIYKGGGICLKSVNETCYMKTDCAPDAEFCLNNLCQTRDEVINRSCKTDSDCKGLLGDLNHVCDQNSRRCVYDIWPRDSGCTHKSQCLYNSKFPESAECRILDTDTSPAVLTIKGTFSGTSIGVSNSSIKSFNEIKDSITGVYATVVNSTDNQSYIGRYRINNIKGNNITLAVPSVTEQIFKGQQGNNYELNFGTEKDGICLVKFPTGTPPSLVKGSPKIRNSCVTGKELNGYCVEKDRTITGKNPTDAGGLEQVCTSDPKKLGCNRDLALVCTYDNTLVSSFNSGVENFHVTSGLSVNKQIIKDIGRCKKQQAHIYESCSDNCVKPLVCLAERDINSNIFRYCGYEWNVMNDVSNLTGCPIKNSLFDFDTTFDTQCKSNQNTFCFSDSDCVPKYRCGGPSDSSSIAYNFNIYDPATNTYPSTYLGFNKFFFPRNNPPTILTSKEGTLDGKPNLFGYYYKSDNTYTFEYAVNGLRNPYNSIIITFSGVNPIKEPEFSLTHMGGDVYRLNVGYIIKHNHTRRREFISPNTFNFYDSALADGTSVYFEGYTGVYNISYEENYIRRTPKSSTGTSTINILKVNDSSGTAVPVSSFNNATMVTYSNRYSANTNSDSFSVESQKCLIDTGDFFKYFEGDAGNSIQYVTSATYTDYTSLTQGTCFYSVALPQPPKDNIGLHTVRKELYFNEVYQHLNGNPTFDGNGYDYFGIRTKVSTSFSAANSYIEMQPLNGFHFLPITITPNTNTIQNITIQSNSTYVHLDVDGSSGVSIFNKPIGYFSDTSDITSEIGMSNILLTYKYAENDIHVLSMNYKLSDSAGIDNFTEIRTHKGTCYIYYTIDNSLKLPSLKVPAVSGYGLSTRPYDIDQVRYFENNNNPNTDTISILSTYKDINPDNPRTSVGNISTMRKLQLKTILNNPTPPKFFQPSYQGIEVTPAPVSLTESIPFGSTGYVTISKINKEINDPTSEINFYLEGTDSIFFRVKKDIEVILKYGARDLVISYNGNKNAISLVGIKEYNVDSKGVETLETQAAFFLDTKDTLNTDSSPKLYYNGIYPISVSIGTSAPQWQTEKVSFLKISDGRNIFSSASIFTETVDKKFSFKFLKSDYNKILYKTDHQGPTTEFSFFNCFILQNGYSETDGGSHNYASTVWNNGRLDQSNPVIVNFSSTDDIITDFSSNGVYHLDFAIYKIDSLSLPTGNILFVTNNRYLSSTTISSDLIFLNNARNYNNFTILGKFRTTNKQILNRESGSIFSKMDTFPFYTGLPNDEGMLDETYLKEIKWPYWISNLNTGAIQIKKIILSYNPGNMENDMFYYCLATVSSTTGNTNLLLYLSTNFTVNDIKESHSVPIVVSDFSKMSQNIKMLPYNKNLLFLSNFCS